jgi:hypothetical protein
MTEETKPRLSGRVEPIWEFEGSSLMGYAAHGHVDPARW